MFFAILNHRKLQICETRFFLRIVCLVLLDEGKENIANQTPLPFKFRTPRLNLAKARNMKKNLRSRSDPPRPSQPMTPLTPLNWGRHLPNPWLTPWVDGPEVLLDEVSFLGSQNMDGDENLEVDHVIMDEASVKPEVTELIPNQDLIDLKATYDQPMQDEANGPMKFHQEAGKINGNEGDGSTDDANANLIQVRREPTRVYNNADSNMVTFEL